MRKFCLKSSASSDANAERKKKSLENLVKTNASVNANNFNFGGIGSWEGSGEVHPRALEMSQSREEENLDKEMEEESKETVAAVGGGGPKEEVTLDDETEEKGKAAAAPEAESSRKRPKSEDEGEAAAAAEKGEKAKEGESSATTGEDGRRLTRKKPKVDYSEAAQAAAAAEVRFDESFYHFDLKF